MKKLLLILTIVILAGCSPQRRLARLLERHPQPTKIDTFFTPGATVYRDTTVTKYLPGETVTVNVPFDVPIDLPDTIIIAETSLATALAYLDDNHLGLDLIQNDTILQWMLDSAIREHSDTIRITEEKIVTVEKLVNKPFYRSGFFILAGLIIIVLFFYFLLRR